MNEWNPNPLRSWKPWAPSPKISARLFAERGVPNAECVSSLEFRIPHSAFRVGHGWHWLAPSMAAFVLAAFALGKTSPHLTGFAGLSSTSLVATVAFSHPTLASFSDTAHHSDANMLPVTKFPSTIREPSLTTPRSVGATNQFPE